MRSGQEAARALLGLGGGGRGGHFPGPAGSPLGTRGPCGQEATRSPARRPQTAGHVTRGMPGPVGWEHVTDATGSLCSGVQSAQDTLTNQTGTCCTYVLLEKHGESRGDAAGRGFSAAGPGSRERGLWGVPRHPGLQQLRGEWPCRPHRKKAPQPPPVLTASRRAAFAGPCLRAAGIHPRGPTSAPSTCSEGTHPRPAQMLQGHNLPAALLGTKWGTR